MTSNSTSHEHLGHMLYESLSQKPPNDICQIDAATGEEETFGSVLSRSIQLAKSLRRKGLKPGDVLALGGSNHLDLHIPYYAALFNGLPVSGVDPYFKYDEITALFRQTLPAIAFCDPPSHELYRRAADQLGLEVTIVTFRGGSYPLNQFIQDYRDDTEEPFQPAVFDTDRVYAWLLSTSGTTGTPKVASFKHHVLSDCFGPFIHMFKRDPDKPRQMGLNLSPVQWISSYFHAMGLVLADMVRLQTSRTDNVDHIIDVINKYRPVYTVASPSTILSFISSSKPCDMTCFDIIIITGSKVYKDQLIEMKSRMRSDALLLHAYGQSETVGGVLIPNPKGPLESCGIPSPNPKVQLKLVDPETGYEVTEPYVTGELLSKGPRFTEFYNNPEETAKAFTEDGWLRSGDLLYRDEHHNYYFVDRLKMVFKYRGFTIMPPQLEEVICQHPGVLEVCVTGVPHAEDGQRPAACVVLKDGRDVSTEDIKRLVADKLSDSQQLRGGVVFVKELPKTSTGKIARMKVRDIVLEKTLNE